MIFSDLRLTRLWLQLTDGILAFGSMLLAFWVRVYVLPKIIPLDSREIGQFSGYLPYAIMMGLLAPLVLERRGLYRHFAIHKRAGVFAFMVEVSLVLFLVAIAMIFFFKETPSRLVFVLFVPLFSSLLALREQLFYQVCQARRRAGQYSVNLLLVTDSEPSAERWANLFSDSATAARLARFIHPGKTTLEDFVQALHKESAGIVLFEVDSSHLPWAVKAIQACEEEGVEAWLSTSFVGSQIARAHFEDILNRNLLVFRTTRAGTWKSIVKVIFDRVASTLLLTLLSPVFAIIWIAIKLESPGHAFFRQRRSGRHGEPFTMFKFRTMHTDAEMRHAELITLNEMSGPVFKIKNDPRVTKVGKILRFTSLDELPQLINVFLGNMSLVGPRPLPTYETLSMTANAQRRRLSVSPGITCLWQISGRNDVKDFSDWVRLDLEYIDQWSLMLDIKILLRTIPAVLFGRGAR